MSDNKKLLDGLDTVGSHARYEMLDAIYGEMFNLQNELRGNTEANDIDWLAAEIFERIHVGGQFHTLKGEQLEMWRTIARQSIASLALLMERIGDRTHTYADVLDNLLKADRMEREKETRR